MLTNAQTVPVPTIRWFVPMRDGAQLEERDAKFAHYFASLCTIELFGQTLIYARTCSRQDLHMLVNHPDLLRREYSLLRDGVLREVEAVLFKAVPFDAASIKLPAGWDYEGSDTVGWSWPPKPNGVNHADD